MDALHDMAFLHKLDLERVKTYYVKVIVFGKLSSVYLNMMKDNETIVKEAPLRSIEGLVSNGNISIDGSSAVRRNATLTFLAEEKENDLTNIDNLLSMNKKVQILIGIENNIDKRYDDIIWFNQGMFVISQASLIHNTTGVNINLQLKDKMCLLNGECGGNLPTSITFDSYDQIIGYTDCISDNSYPQDPNDYTVYRIKDGDEIVYKMWNKLTGWTSANYSLVGTRISVKQRIYDIIQTLVCNYGGEDIAKIIINDVPLELKASVRYIGNDTLYFDRDTGIYTCNQNEENGEKLIPFNYNEDCGYIYTDFTYPSSNGLVSAIGDNICSVLDKIKNTLGNYEYFYDIDGNFVFQQIKNYLNTSYSPLQSISNINRDDSLSFIGYLLDSEQKNELTNLNGNYFVDFSNYTESTYTFEQGSSLINSYSNSPNYQNIKNDFHIWGENEDKRIIHYHLVIKEKPKEYGRYFIVETDDKDINGNSLGKIRLATTADLAGSVYVENEVIKNLESLGNITINNEILDLLKDIGAISVENETLIFKSGMVKEYVPTDWRAELYMQGLTKISRQQRPDIYEQELLDLFDSIYDMANKKWKTDIINRPNDLTYWFDYLEPVGDLFDISVDMIGSRIYSYQKENIIKLYNNDIPNEILINLETEVQTRARIIDKCEKECQSYTMVSDEVYNNMAIGTVGYTAQETMRELLYQYTDYAAGINLTSIPIYYMDVNKRITVNDYASGIFGDYIIKTINLPLDAKNTMSISATKALKRI